MPASTTEPNQSGEQSGDDVIEADTYQLPSKCVTSQSTASGEACHDRLAPEEATSTTDNNNSRTTRRKPAVVERTSSVESSNENEVFKSTPPTTRSGRTLRRNNHLVVSIARSFRFPSHRRTVSQLIEEISSRTNTPTTTPKQQRQPAYVQRSATLDRWPRRGDASKSANYPSYVPSYIRYSPKVDRNSTTSMEDEALSKRAATLSLMESRTKLPPAAAATGASCHTSPTLRRLRDRSSSDETHGEFGTTNTVPVQTAIASMERNCMKTSSVKSSTSSTSTDGETSTNNKPTIKLTPPLGGVRSSGVGGCRNNYEPNFLRQGRITRNSRNRRSMSDPNIQKTFLEVKRLWDEKAKSSAKRGGGSNEIINRRAIGIKPLTTTTTTKPATIVHNNKVTPPPKAPKLPPATSSNKLNSSPPTRVWNNVSKTPTRRFDYDKSIEQVEGEVKELEIETTKERSSVFATAMLFGPTGRPRSPFLREKPRAESSPLAPPSTATTTTTNTKEHPKTPPPVDISRKPFKKPPPSNTNSFLATSLAAKAATTTTVSDVTEDNNDVINDHVSMNDKENRSTIVTEDTQVEQIDQAVVVTSGNEGDNETSSSNNDVTVANNEEEMFVANEGENVVALQRNASLARERRKSGKQHSIKQQQQQRKSSESSENDKTITDNKNSNDVTAPRRSFLHRPSSIQRRNIASSDGNNSTRSSTVSSAASSVYGQSDMGPLDLLGAGGGQKSENRLSGAEEMIERRLERFKRDETSPIRSRPNVLEIKSGERSRAHTMDIGTDEMIPRAKRSSSIASPNSERMGGDSNVSTPVTNSSGMRPDSMSSNMSTTSGEFNLASEYDKIAQQLAEEDDVENDDVDDDTLKRTSKKRNVESQGDRKSVEVPSKQRAEDWTDEVDGVVEEDSCPPAPPVAPVAVVPPTPVPPPAEPVSREKKLYNIAKELLSTEETYVEVLYLIDQVFHKTVVDAVAQKSIMPEAVVTGIFGHVSPIYNFHSQHLLQRLRDRINNNWETTPMIGDIMVVAAPFLKMYSLYVQQFNEAMELIKTWQQKSSAFAAIMANIHKRPECGGLTLQNHMLTPVQRIPRYEMLLIDYLSRLSEDSPDYEQTTKAVDLIKTAAKHSNQTIRKLEKFHKLVQIFNQLSDVNFDIVDVSRELYKEGKIIKISARSGEKHDRYLYLFSDMLLCCAPLRGISVKNYRVTAKLDLEGMHVSREVHSSSNPNSNAYNCTFCVRGLQKTMEFQASNDEEKEKWITALNSAIEEHNERKSTFLHRGSLQRDGDVSPSNPLPPHSPTIIDSPASLSRTAALTADLVSDAELGIRAPRWIKDHEVTMCMCCSKSFTFRRRRHHCRACGRVICSECSEHKFVLQYEQSKSQRVCTNCYKVLTGRERQEEADKKGVLEVEADEVTEHSVIADYLYFSEGEKKKNWTRMWCVIPNEQLCIYFYAAPQDVRAQLTLPLPGFAVNKLNSHDHKFAFKVSQGGKTMRFGAKDKLQMDRWIYAISHASKGEDLTRSIVYNLGKPPSSPPPVKHPDAVTILPTTPTSGVGHPRVVSSSSEEEFFPNGQSTAP